jgi:phosphoserine phosphatase RsbU/P
MAATYATQCSSARLLVADDQPHILTALELLLGCQGYQIECASNPAAVLSALEAQAFDSVLLDLNYTRDTTGGAEGLELVSKIRSMDPAIPLIVMTAWGNVELAVEAMRRGASDFIQKPWNNSELLEKVREQVEHCRALRRSQRRQELESQAAQEIQRNLLPGAIPQVPGYEISAISRPLHFIGGDYYDVAPIGESHLAVCIADVAGKGLPGALLMSNLQAALKPLMRPEVQPQELCERLNRTLCAIMPDDKFISLFYGVMDYRSHRLSYCNAGHNPPWLVGTDGRLHELTSSGAVLGRFPRGSYAQADLRLEPGDSLVLFTDGIIEACNQAKEPFGESSLVECARPAAGDNAMDLQNKLWDAASRHCSGRFQDDVTLMVVRRVGRC